MISNKNLDWAALWSEVVSVEVQQPVYRLYHDDRGQPLFYSMERGPGNYIDITPEQFAAADSHVRVKDGKLVKTYQTGRRKLIPDNNGDIACARHSVTIVSDQQPYQRWKLKHYDTD